MSVVIAGSVVSQSVPRELSGRDLTGRPAATPREVFGSVLVALARLYSAAEKCGDVTRAERYATAVDVLLAACPATPENDEAGGSGVANPLGSSWPAQESTLIGLGVLQ